MSRRPRFLLFLVLAVLAAAAAGATMVTRVPPGRRAASARGWLGPGWHLRPPLATLPTVAESGEIDVAPIDAATPEGASHRYEVHLRYTIPPGDVSAPFALRVRQSGGLAPAIAPLLAGAFADELRDAKGTLARRGVGSDAVGAALVSRLRDAGLAVASLEWRRTDVAAGAPLAALPPAERSKILMIGLDAADWEIIDPLMAQGKLPHLAALARGGARAPLRSYDPMISPLIWTTMVTGVGPDAHGIADFLVTDEGSGRLIPITSRFRRVKALWNMLSDAGMSSGFVGWWASFPAEAVNGYLITDLMGFSLLTPGAQTGKSLPGVTHPASYYAEIRPRLILPDAVGYDEVRRFVRATRAEFDASLSYKPPTSRTPGAPPAAQDPVWLVRRTLAVTHNYETIALDLLHRDLDVVGVYFEGIDMMGHRFQHCLPPRMALCPDDEYEKEQGAVTAFYEYQDEIIGRLVAAAPGRVVAVVSDHGFRNGADRPPDDAPYTTGQPVEWHREYGVLVLHGPGIRSGTRLAGASVYDVAPTLLYLSGLPQGEDMPGAVLASAIEPQILAAHPPRRIPSFEDTGTARTAGDAALSPEAQQEMVESLQALGYVGPLPTGPAAGGGRSGNGAPGGSGATAGVAASVEATRVTYHRNLATFYMKSGRLAEAETELTEANRLEPLPKSYGMLSEIRAARGDIDGAVAFLEEGLSRFPEMDEEAVLWMIDLRLKQNRPDLAAQALERFRAHVKRPALIATCEGKLAAAAGDQDRAIASFLEALGREPALSPAALAAAPLLDARGRLGELEPFLRRALGSERRIDEYQNLLGVILLQKGRAGEALQSIAEALDVDPPNARFLENYAAAALAARKPELALARYRAGVAHPRADGATWSGLGRLLGITKKPADAATAFAKALALGDTTAATYAGYATALIQSGARDRSRAIIQEGLRAWPADPALTALQRQAG